MNMNASKFYGKRKVSNIAVQVEERTCMIKKNPIPYVQNPGILNETQIWKVFSQQAPALQLARDLGLGLMVFAFEGIAIGECGKRKFVVCHPKVLWKNIKDRPLNSRCTYEVIPENEVCKLYFDLEFSKELNCSLDGVDLTHQFIKVVNYFLKKEFSVNCHLNDILFLDSSTEKKFSTHLIYNSPKTTFANNYHAGNFVNMVCDFLRCINNSPDKDTGVPDVGIANIRDMFVENNSKSKVIFCDEGVYTKNRNFRIFKSSKLGKNSPLLISAENKYIPPMGGEEEHYFLNSLVTYVTEQAKVLIYGNKDITEESSLVSIPVGFNSSKSCLHSNSSLSPYSEIENYIESLLGEGSIKSWHYFRQGELLVFEIGNMHKFCYNIGREHKSNRVIYVVNLCKGIFYQKCHDPVCKGYRSPEQSLPQYTMPWKSFSDEFLDWQMHNNLDWQMHDNDVFEDEILIQAVIEAEQKTEDNDKVDIVKPSAKKLRNLEDWNIKVNSVLYSKIEKEKDIEMSRIKNIFSSSPLSSESGDIPISFHSKISYANNEVTKHMNEDQLPLLRLSEITSPLNSLHHESTNDLLELMPKEFKKRKCKAYEKCDKKITNCSASFLEWNYIITDEEMVELAEKIESQQN